MNKELIYEIIMPDFPRKVKLSDHQRAKYWLKKDKLPAKFLIKKDEELDGLSSIQILDRQATNKDKYPSHLRAEYYWKNHKKGKGKSELRLASRETDEYILKNPNVAGTERWIVVNGQKFYNGGYNPFTAGKVMERIHEYMLPFLEGLRPITTYPLIIDGFMYDYVKEDDISEGKLWDSGNRQFPYNKAFEDILQKCGVIKQDDVNHIIGHPRLIFVNLDTKSIPKYHLRYPPGGTKITRTLVYQIYKVCE